MTILLHCKNNASEETVLEGAVKSRLSFLVIPKKRTACEGRPYARLLRYAYLTHSLRVFSCNLNLRGGLLRGIIAELPLLNGFSDIKRAGLAGTVAWRS